MNAHENENYPFPLTPIRLDEKFLVFLRLDLVVVLSAGYENNSEDWIHQKTLIFVRNRR